MTVFMVPPLESSPWPTLGPGVAQLMEDGLAFGPGDLRGQPYRLDDEKRALLYRMYEVYPKGHALEGRRRFSRAALSMRKGVAKTEFGAAIAAVELHPEGPVRCDGWRKVGKRWEPVGAPVTDPYIPLVAYTEEQSDDLAFAALKVMVSEGSFADVLDVWAEQVVRKGGDGKAVSLAGAPNARDGARTTFQLFDETHRMTLPRLKEAHRTMLANLPKRRLADPWALEVTTAPEPGAGSVAETTMDYAKSVGTGVMADSKLFFFHREASEKHDLTTVPGVRAAVIEASGPTAVWSNIDAIVEQWQDPTADRAYLERVWLNRLVAGSTRAFDGSRWKDLAVKHSKTVPERAAITLGFDGSRFDDATALIATEVASGYQWALGIWQRPVNAVEWEVPRAEVDAAIDKAFDTWDVLRLYADPPHWDSEIAAWAGRYGKERVNEWWTNRRRQMAYALRAYANAMSTGDVEHCAADGPRCRLFTEHVGNACRLDIGYRDDGGALWIVQKDRPNSVHKIDAAVAATLSWEARNDAIAAGALNLEQFDSAYAEPRSLLV